MDVERMENYALKRNLRGYKSWLKEITDKNNSDYAQEMDSIRRQIVSIFGEDCIDVYKPSSPNSKDTVTNYTKKLYNFLDELHVCEKLEERKNVILDVNMGCPVPKVVKNGEGSALLKNPELAGRIIEAMIKETGKPVTAKIRMGWDEHSVNAVEVAKILEQAGASAVAVHGRTREQYYTGKADWDIIREVKQAVNIPVIGNGDIFSGQDALDMMKQTGCDLVMIARGALGNPWIFAEAKALWEGKEPPKAPDANEKREMLEKHFCDLLELKGEYAAVREMRKHTGWYLKGMPGAAAMRREINQITDAQELKYKLRRIR